MALEIKAIPTRFRKMAEESERNFDTRAKKILQQPPVIRLCKIY